MERSNTKDVLPLSDYLIRSAENGNDLLYKLADLLPGIVYIYNTDTGTITYTNNRITNTLGYSYEDIRERQNDLLSFVVKEDRPLVKEALENFHDTEKNNTPAYRCRMTGKDGHLHHFRMQGAVLNRNKEGKPVEILLTAEDITDQVRSESEATRLKETQNQLEQLLHFGTFYYDAGTDSLEWSEGMYHLFEIDRQTGSVPINLAHYLSMVEEHDRVVLAEKVRKCVEKGETYSFTYIIRTAKDNRKIVTSRTSPVRDADGRIKGIAGSLQDVSEEISRQQELVLYKRQMEEKEQFLEFGSWERSVEENTFTWSEGMYHLFGYDPATDKDTLVIDDALYEQHISPEDRELGSRHLQEVMNKNGNYYVWEYGIATLDGTEKRLETFAKLIRDETNRLIKIIGTTRDITQLRYSERTLESKVRELNRSNKELEEFAYVASHDLQEPLRKLSTFTERLATNFDDQLGADGRVYTQRILAATENMRVLIDNLLEFSRVARQQIPFEKTDLNAVVQNVLSDLELSIEESGAAITVENLPSVDGISLQFRQLFTNLLNNALKFSRPGVAPAITITSAELNRSEKETLHLPADRKYFKIILTDNGIGFEQEYAERIFQIFQRLHGKVEFPGSGVGLAICKKIVENHEGLISAKGDIDKGATFTITLPQKHS